MSMKSLYSAVQDDGTVYDGQKYSLQHMYVILEFLEDFLLVTNNIVIDGLLIYRCYFVWCTSYYKKTVVILPMVLLLSTTVVGYVTVSRNDLGPPEAHFDSRIDGYGGHDVIYGHRATDTLLCTLARDGFQSPHTLLSDYVERATGYRPDNNLEFMRTENQDRKQLSIGSISCRVLEYQSPASGSILTGFIHSAGYTSLTSALHDVLFHYSFIDSQLSRIAVDEAIMLVSAAHRFCTVYPDPYASEGLSPRATFLDIIQGYPPTSSRVFATSLATHLPHAFDPVYRVFSFVPRSPPAWSKPRAEIVALSQPDGRPAQYSVADSSALVLAIASTSLEENHFLAHPWWFRVAPVSPSFRG
ncbi:hypothetical protein DFH09DRAFT_1486170 [Mycena vulgaris]|nr:hypothetical protein DFH09DRAFT_1486170 [Mycena vulgaris]